MTLEILPTKEANENAKQLWDAEHVQLDGRAMTREANALVAALLSQVSELDSRQYQSDTRRAKLRRAIEAFTGALLLAQAGDEGSSKYISFSTAAASFKGEVKRRSFDEVRKAFGSLGYIEDKPGYNARWGGPSKGALTRFRAMVPLLQLGAANGINPDNVEQHFAPGLPKYPLILKRAAFQGDPEGGEWMQIPPHLKPSGDALAEAVKELNAFLSKHTITNGVHHGYLRVFNCGDNPEFDWNMGGRLFSQGRRSFQRQPEAERLNMLIGGEPVCELDISACYLSIFLAWHGEQIALEQDPYALEGFGSEQRAAVKAWFTVSFGKGALVTKWSRNTVEDYAAKHSPMDLEAVSPVAIKSAALARYPVLARIETDRDPKPLWARLMWHESEIIQYAMTHLMKADIPSLAIFDGIIVPQSSEVTARDALELAFRKVTQDFKPRLSVSYPDP